MKSTIIIFCFMLASLQTITCWVAAMSRPSSCHGHHLPSRQGGVILDTEGEASRREMISRLGSRPPSCEHSCGGCSPCYATQVPTINHRLRLHYANYELEGWKSKCGSTFFNP